MHERHTAHTVLWREPLLTRRPDTDPHGTTVAVLVATRKRHTTRYSVSAAAIADRTRVSATDDVVVVVVLVLIRWRVRDATHDWCASAVLCLYIFVQIIYIYICGYIFSYIFSYGNRVPKVLCIFIRRGVCLCTDWRRGLCIRITPVSGVARVLPKCTRHLAIAISIVSALY